MSGHKHEDMNAYIMTVGTSNSTTVTAFSGTHHAKMHHINIYNSSPLEPVEIHVKAYEGGIGQLVNLQSKVLQPEQFFRWQGALGDDDYLVVQGVNESKDYDIDVHLAWW